MHSPPDPSKTSPLLPWEVIERVIGHSYDLGRPYYKNSRSILNFSLTCRDLRPRTLCFLVADVVLHSREKVFDFFDFLQAKPHLKPFVRSICVDFGNFVPIPLLQVHVLPNLSKIEFRDWNFESLYLPSLNQSTLTCSQLLSAHIQTLSLCVLCFKSSIYFFQIPSAFPNILHLVCEDAFIKQEDKTSALEVAKQRLSQRLHLRTVSFQLESCSD